MRRRRRRGSGWSWIARGQTSWSSRSAQTGPGRAAAYTPVTCSPPSPGSVNAALHRCTVDEPVPVHVFRRQRLVEAIVTPTAAPPERVELKLREGATDREQRLLDAWLGPEAEHENGKGGDE